MRIRLPENVEELAKLPVAEQNRRMAKEGLVMPLVERMMNPAEPSIRGASEAVVKALEASNPCFEGIEVSGCDKVNGNRRIYPTRAAAAALERMKPRLDVGRVYGAIDHPRWSDGAMKDAPILWTNVYLNALNKVLGDYQITAEHSRGKDLIANLKAGWGIAFSTRGYATAHYPTPEEKLLYGLVDGQDDDVVIIDDNLEWIAIDVVDNPSWPTATQNGGTPPASKKDNQGGDPPTQEQIVMKNLAELIAAHPVLVAEAETAAVTKATKDVQTKLTTAEANTTKLGDLLKTVFTTAAPVLGLSLERQLTTTEVAAQIGTLNERIAGLETDKTKVENELAALKTLHAAIIVSRDEALSKIASAERREKVLTALPVKLKDNAYAKLITDRVMLKLDDAKFDEAALVTFIADQTKDIKAIADTLENKKHGLQNTQPDPETPADEATATAERKARKSAVAEALA